MTGIVAETRKRHRPSSLDLKGSNLNVGDATKDMKDYALKCVSPGLPPLSAKMKSTVSMSNSIAAQQREIIQSRKQENSDDDEVEMNDDNDNDDDNNETKDESLSIPTAQNHKRLQREHAPPPLNLSLAHKSSQPTIKSAPIYNINPSFHRQQLPRRRLYPTTTRNAQFPSTIIMTPNGPAKLISTPQHQFFKRPQYPPSAYRQQQIASAYWTPARNGLPLTQNQLAKYQEQIAFQQEQWAKFKKGSHVTDVFEGDATRLAPVTSQPLSAQREFFHIDHEKSKSKESDEDSDQGPESNAIEENAKPEHDNIHTELRISDNIFRFEITGKNDKERFLSHCAAAWDTFEKSH